MKLLISFKAFAQVEHSIICIKHIGNTVNFKEEIPSQFSEHMPRALLRNLNVMIFRIVPLGLYSEISGIVITKENTMRIKGMLERKIIPYFLK